jgi:hypothetical protein
LRLRWQCCGARGWVCQLGMWGWADGRWTDGAGPLAGPHEESGKSRTDRVTGPGRNGWACGWALRGPWGSRGHSRVHGALSMRSVGTIQDAEKSFHYDMAIRGGTSYRQVLGKERVGVRLTDRRKVGQHSQVAGSRHELAGSGHNGWQLR